MKAKGYCCLNGKMIPLEKAGVNLYDLGVLRGYGVFDVARTYSQKPFLLKEHLDRLENSASALNLKVPLSQKKLSALVSRLIRKNKFNNGREAIIRTIITGGETDDGFSLNGKPPTMFILIEEFKNLPRFFYEKGAKLITANYQREMPRVKTINYINAIRLQELRKKSGALEILYTFGGKALEAATSNFFVFKKDRLITPKDNVLLGIIRNLVLKLAKRDFKTEERVLSLREVARADEAFITATNKDIVPVVKIGNLTVGNGKVGARTRHLMKKLSDYVQKR